MTFEERMDLLRQSIESHDRQIGELVENTVRNEALIAQASRNGEQTDARLAAFIEATQINFDRLTKAMTGLVEHAANHARRIERLEGQ